MIFGHLRISASLVRLWLKAKGQIFRLFPVLSWLAARLRGADVRCELKWKLLLLWDAALRQLNGRGKLERQRFLCLFGLILLRLRQLLQVLKLVVKILVYLEIEGKVN